jgi:hypothetical protein
MSVTAIVAYGCNIDFSDSPPSYGTLLQRTLFHVYFRGKQKCLKIHANLIESTLRLYWWIELISADDCNPVGWGNVDLTAIQNLDLMTSETVNIWMWVVAGLSLVWLFSSVTLITSKKLLEFMIAREVVCMKNHRLVSIWCSTCYRPLNFFQTFFNCDKSVKDF